MSATTTSQIDRIVEQLEALETELQQVDDWTDQSRDRVLRGAGGLVESVAEGRRVWLVRLPAHGAK